MVIGKSISETIYDRYAPVMYGSILQMVKKKRIADRIMTEIFAEFQTIFKNSTSELPERIWFIKFALKKTALFLKSSVPALPVSFKNYLTQHTVSLQAAE